MTVQNVKLRLDAWRDAERRRDGHTPGGTDWQEAEAEVRTAETTFHAELAQASARYAELEFQYRDQGWSKLVDHAPSRAGD